MKNRIYFDNAATTPIHQEVIDAMLPYMIEKFGNPSSIYSFGRETKQAIEQARKIVAHYLNTKPAQIFFTSGGTESSNMAINSAVEELNCTRIITSAIEHHATLYCAQYWQKVGRVQLEYVNLKEEGVIDYEHLEELLKDSTHKTLVTLMHANNEIGNILDVVKVGDLCEQYSALFHCDAVQTIAHYPLDVQQMKVHFLSGAGHKFHGPKGIGIMYINENVSIAPALLGGSQERNMRAGTENVYGIVGLAKALEIAYDHLEQDSLHIQSLKQYMYSKIKTILPEAIFNGDVVNGLYTVLNISLPKTSKTEMLIMNLDINGICVSGGSACSSGVESISHVIAAIRGTNNMVPIRFSFSKYNTLEEIDIVIEKLKEVIA
jgi:cysteine desulfurase